MRDEKSAVQDLRIGAITGAEAIRNYVKQLSAGVLEEMMNANVTIKSATIGPKQVLMTPFDSVVMETVSKECDIVGLRCLVFFKSDFESGKLEELNEWYISVRKPNAYLSNAVECMAVEKAD